MRVTALALSGAAVVTALLLAGSAGAVTHPKLVGNVGINDAFKITLKRNGVKVTTLKHGTYTLVVHDGSTFHDFRLRRPNGTTTKFTTEQFVGTKTFTITLTPGKHKVFCFPHQSEMFQRFTVT